MTRAQRERVRSERDRFVRRELRRVASPGPVGLAERCFDLAGGDPLRALDLAVGFYSPRPVRA